MKNRWIYLALALVMAFSCCTFSIRTEAAAEDSTSGENVTDNRTKPTPAPDVSEADFETSGYLYESRYGGTIYIVVVRNNSEAAVEVSCDGTAKDASGNTLAVDDASIDVLGPGETSYTILRFRDTTGVASVDTQMTYNDDSYYKPVLKDISFSEVLNNDNVIITAANNGTQDALFLEGIAIFLDGSGNVLSYETNYIVDGESELKSGETLSKAYDAPENYDHVDVYLSARSDGTPADPIRPAAEGYDVTEYLYATRYNTIDYLSIKNNTDEACGIYGNAIAKDAAGSVVDAAELNIDVLGPGETQLGSFSFRTDAAIATVEYQLYRNMNSYYQPVVSSLSVEATASGQNIILAVTNNGTVAAEFVEAECLFFDKDGKIVGTDSEYIVDDDYEIKPNATETEQVSTSQAYTYALIFMSGRAEGHFGSSTTDADYTPSIKPEYQKMNTVVSVGDVPTSTSAPETAGTAETTDTSADSSQTTGGVSSEFKKTMDSYEEFFNQYAEFMKSYSQNPSDLTLMTQYVSLMSQYVDTMSQLESLDTGTLSEADLAYYTEVMLRIDQMLVGVMG